MLLAADILQPGDGTMSIEYMGQTFIGDLLEDGKIRSQETDLVFASPSAWAIACKRFINPVRKSGCGWSSVRYKGRKLDAYKIIWYKRKKDELSNLLREELEEETFNANQCHTMTSPQFVQRIVVKHNTMTNRTFTHDANTMIECVPFSNLGKIQPFLISMSTNAALLMDFHCHLTKSEVSGYLAGQWDVNAHNLNITHAFPCRNTKSDRENAPQVEMEISKAIDKLKLVLVGWYHSHPYTAAAPTLRDVDVQLDYQIKMKGLNDSNYTPCVGIIISPYNFENASLESNIIAYWVIPPPENKPNEYGRPMLMSYSVVQDSTMSICVKEEMKKCVDYYSKDMIKFTDKYVNTTSYIEKLKSSLISKFPLDLGDTTLWPYIRDLVGCSVDEESLLSIPNVSKSSQMLPTLNTPVSLSSNLMLSSDIANVLFNSGKFPSASSLLGLPDPMAHSTLAANNMFLSTNLFKMQDLLKPVSTSSPTIKSTKSETTKAVPLKIPTDIKKLDFSNDLANLMSLKNAYDYQSNDYNTSFQSDGAMDTKSISLSDVSKSSAADFSLSKSSVTDYSLNKTDFSLNLSTKDSETDRSIDLGNNETMETFPKFIAPEAKTHTDQPINLASNT
ncbi:PREDICTED: MPN domain-containing protein CG4751-like isoform X2 [Nicrophorus vespilloides]|nr:PREDICTED: MPN domain-containing protein CG4751-like isoform X2 [Nicrophorus vespilloides]